LNSDPHTLAGNGLLDALPPELTDVFQARIEPVDLAAC